MKNAAKDGENIGSRRVKRKSIAYVVGIILSLLMIFTGCSSTSQPTKSEPLAAQPDSKEASKQNGNQTVLKLAFVFPSESPSDKGAQKFAELTEKGTNGKVKVEIYSNGQLGGDKQLLDSMKFGAIDIVLIGETAFSMAAPRYAGLSAPYLFRDVEHLHKVLYGPIGEEMKKEFNKNLNATVLDWWDRSPRNLTANQEIKSVDQLKGKKIRVPEIPLLVQSWSALGAVPSPMAWTEVFTALETKVVDGQENPIDIIYNGKIQEVQSHLMLTEHSITPVMMFINDKKLASFPKDVQKVITDAAIEAGNYQKEMVKNSEQEYLQKVKEAGMKLVEVDKSSFIKKLEEANVEAKFAKEWTPNLLQRIRDTK